MFPIGTDAPQRRVPYMNIALIVANVIVYFLSHKGSPLFGMGLAPGWGRYMLHPRHIHVRQFITYQFLHEGFWHIFGNMLFLWVFGNNLNDKIGNFPYLLVYIAGGIVAGIGQVLTSHHPTLGASGSISAVTGLFFVLLPVTNIRVWLWFYLVEISSMYFILAELILNFAQQYWFKDNVAHWAHITGMFFGFLVGVLLLATGLVQRDHYDLLAMLQRWRRRRRYEALVTQGYNPFQNGGGAATTSYAPKAPKRQLPAAPSAVSPAISALRGEISELLRNHDVPTAARKYLELRGLDANQVLPAQGQLDVSNQLMHDRQYDDAAGAYETYLKYYVDGPQSEQVQLMLGLLYAHYQPQPQRAMELLRKVIPRLHDPAQKDMAQSELRRLEGSGTNNAP